MKIYLEKQGKGNISFLYLDVDNHLLRQTEGKLGLKAVRKTSHCGSYEKAIETAKEISLRYKLKGYIEKLPSEKVTEPLIFDNAQWHYEGDFPPDLNSHQAYIHTGFYIGWVILRNLMSPEFKLMNEKGIQDLKERKITSPKFFEEYMDGIFQSHDLSDEGVKFTKYYFNTDFSKSAYISDLIKYLVRDLPTIYHIQDNWENFGIIESVIDKRFQEWW